LLWIRKAAGVVHSTADLRPTSTASSTSVSSETVMLNGANWVTLLLLYILFTILAIGLGAAWLV
jgi:hypothetical protein